jgi:hypothetical protein
MTKEAMTQEVKSKDGRNIIVSIETFKDPIGNTPSAGEYHTLLTLTDKKTKAIIGRMPFPKATKDVLEKQMEITINNIDQYLDVISKG